MNLDKKREPCKRQSGSFRAYFQTREEAEAFARDLANPAYLGDIAHLCAKCGFWHLSQPSWIEPQLTHQDAALLESMGIEAPAKAPGETKCAQCHVAFRTGIDFFILPDGRIVCGTNCMPYND